jgi:hypothetical protein
VVISELLKHWDGKGDSLKDAKRNEAFGLSNTARNLLIRNAIHHRTTRRNQRIWRQEIPFSCTVARSGKRQTIVVNTVGSDALSMTGGFTDGQETDL